MENQARLAEEMGYTSVREWLETEYLVKERPYSHIGQDVGVTGVCIRNWARQQGIPARPPEKQNKCLQAVLRLDTAKMTTREIAEITGYSQCWVGRVLEAHGLPYITVRRRT
jgi:predicted O-methyltransferase YrrM